MKFIIRSNPEILEVVSDRYGKLYTQMSEVLESAKAIYERELSIYAYNNAFWAEVEADTAKAALEAFELRCRLDDLLRKIDDAVNKMEVEE